MHSFGALGCCCVPYHGELTGTTCLLCTYSVGYAHSFLSPATSNAEEVPSTPPVASSCLRDRLQPPAGPLENQPKEVLEVDSERVLL